MRSTLICSTTHNHFAVTIGLTIALLLAGCSGDELASSRIGSGGEKRGQTSGSTVAREIGVAGSLGLICVESEASPDQTIANLRCKFLTSDGKKFKEGNDLVYQLSVKNGGIIIPHQVLGVDDSYSFTFSAQKAHLASIVISAKFTNPTTSNSLVLDKTFDLPSVIGTLQFSPAAGVFATPQTVSIRTSTTGAVIVYTDDGSMPNCGSKPYNSAIMIRVNTTIKAVTCIAGSPASVPLTQTYVFSCGSSGYGCYDLPNLQALEDGFKIPISGQPSVLVQLVKADPACNDMLAHNFRCFRVWKDSGSGKILNASGMWSSTNNWQRALATDGKSKSTSFFTTAEQLGGRACPVNVYINDSNQMATGQCLYYQKWQPTRYLVRSWPPGSWESKFLTWAQGCRQTWYQDNALACSEIGMRLPTIYEPSLTVPQYQLDDLRKTNPPSSGGVLPVFSEAGFPAGNRGSHPNLEPWDVWTASTKNVMQSTAEGGQSCRREWHTAVLGSLRSHSGISLSNNPTVQCVLPQ